MGAPESLADKTCTTTVTSAVGLQRDLAPNRYNVIMCVRWETSRAHAAEYRPQKVGATTALSQSAFILKHHGASSRACTSFTHAALPPMWTVVLLLASLASPAVAQTTNVKCVTTAGSFTAVVERSNSPQGVDRFLELVSS